MSSGCAVLQQRVRFLSRVAKLCVEENSHSANHERDKQERERGSGGCAPGGIGGADTCSGLSRSMESRSRARMRKRPSRSSYSGRRNLRQNS